MTKIERCSWANVSLNEQKYHDEEWGTPVKEDHLLFEVLVLESMQSGLSWATILSKRSTLRAAYEEFMPEKVAAFDEQKVTDLLNDPGVIRHKLKIKATITNAQQFLAIQKEWGSFASYIWHFTENQVINTQWLDISHVPSTSPLSEAISKDLKKRGFKFLGPTTVYSFLQAVGIVNDHVVTCFKNVTE